MENKPGMWRGNNKKKIWLVFRTNFIYPPTRILYSFSDTKQIRIHSEKTNIIHKFMIMQYF